MVDSIVSSQIAEIYIGPFSENKWKSINSFKINDGKLTVREAEVFLKEKLPDKFKLEFDVWDNQSKFDVVFFPKKSDRGEMFSFRIDLEHKKRIAIISNIRISKWDGKLISDMLDSGTEGKNDFVIYGKTNKVSGTIKSIDDSLVRIESSEGKLSVPLSKTKKIILIKQGNLETSKKEGAVKAYFNSGRFLQIKRLTIRDGMIEDRILGQNGLPLKYFRVLEFNKVNTCE
jgi:hypothetical protein